VSDPRHVRNLLVTQSLVVMEQDGYPKLFREIVDRLLNRSLPLTLHPHFLWITAIRTKSMLQVRLFTDRYGSLLKFVSARSPEFSTSVVCDCGEPISGISFRIQSMNCSVHLAENFLSHVLREGGIPHQASGQGINVIEVCFEKLIERGRVARHHPLENFDGRAGRPRAAQCIRVVGLGLIGLSRDSGPMVCQGMIHFAKTLTPLRELLPSLAYRRCSIARKHFLSRPQATHNLYSKKDGIVQLTRKIIDITRTLDAETTPWPGDESFELQWTEQLSQGGQTNLSWFKMSPHIGTHVDSPFHVAEDGRRADELDLGRFLGPAWVVDASVAPNGRIPAALLETIDLKLGPRVLLRTQSYPDRRTWSPDFFSLSVELAEALARARVQLVGIDTPGVDPAASTDLAVHHVLHRGGITWLEGLDLTDAPPGLYDFVALPLKLAGAEASPIRAVLIKRED